MDIVLCSLWVHSCLTLYTNWFCYIFTYLRISVHNINCYVTCYLTYCAGVLKGWLLACASQAVSCTSGQYQLLAHWPLVAAAVSTLACAGSESGSSRAVSRASRQYPGSCAKNCDLYRALLRYSSESCWDWSDDHYWAYIKIDSNDDHPYSPLGHPPDRALLPTIWRQRPVRSSVGAKPVTV